MEMQGVRGNLKYPGNSKGEATEPAGRSEYRARQTRDLIYLQLAKVIARRIFTAEDGTEAKRSIKISSKKPSGN